MPKEIDRFQILKDKQVIVLRSLMCEAVESRFMKKRLDFLDLKAKLR